MKGCSRIFSHQGIFRDSVTFVLITERRNGEIIIGESPYSLTRGGIMKWDWIIVMTILLVLLLVSGVYFFDNGIFWIFLVAAGVINTLFNGPNYRNRSYFLINGILLGILAGILYYNSAQIHYPINWIFVFIMIILAFFLLYEFITREKEPSLPWKDEW